MNDITYDRAGPDDYDDVMDFADFVFSQAHIPHDFRSLLPKMYRKEYFMDGIHYLAREGGKIKAMVGAYPLEMEFKGSGVIPGRGIGAVSVHPRARSRGYMKTLMNMALDDMKKDGVVFSCLGGQRQRYEYFGYADAGSAYTFGVREANIRHTLRNDWKSSLELRPLNPTDKETLDCIQAMHEAKNAKLRRSRDRLYEILTSWKANVFALTEGGNFEGYMVCDTHAVSEINLEHPSRMIEALGLLLRLRKEHGGQEYVNVSAGPHETEKISVLSSFAEGVRQSTAFFFNILDFKRFTEPFLKLRAGQRTIADGSFVLKIEGQNGGVFRISSKDGKPEISKTSSTPDLILDPLEAARFLFNPVSALTAPAVGKNTFLQSLLPLPLFFENPDGI